MYKLIKRTYIGVVSRLRSMVRLFTDKGIAHGASYFPEYTDRRKPRIRIWFDQLKNVIKYGDVNDFYYLYGFDIKGLRDEGEYVDYRPFRTRREELMHKHANPQVSILRDKFYFSIVSNANKYSYICFINLFAGLKILLY